MQEKFEDTKGVTRSRQSKDRQHNGQMKPDKMIIDETQYTTQKIENMFMSVHQALFCERNIYNQDNTI